MVAVLAEEESRGRCNCRVGRIWSNPESARVRGLPRARYFSQWLLCVPSFNSLCLNTLGDGELTAGRSIFEALMD